MESDDITEQDVPQDTSGVIEKSLWVDKYSPRSYMELLSDDVSTGFMYNTRNPNNLICMKLSTIGTLKAIFSDCSQLPKFILCTVTVLLTLPESLCERKIHLTTLW